MEMKDVAKIVKSPVFSAGLICLIVGVAAGLMVGGRGDGDWGRRGGDRDGSCGGQRAENEDGCSMMKGMEGMGMHRMPDGSMMGNGGDMDMGSMMMDMTGRMQGKTGDALDKIFLEDMIVHHQGAVDMAELLAKGSARPEMKKFAADIIRVQSAEISQMKAWEKSWFGN